MAGIFSQPERSREHPPHLGVWDNAKILKQVGEIQNLATRLDVQIVDPQFLVSRKGEVKIIDLNHWFFIDSKENYWAYDGKAPERLVEWVDKQNIRNDFSTQVAQALQLLARHCEA